MNDFLQQIRSGSLNSRDKRYGSSQHRNRNYSGNMHGNEKKYKSRGHDTSIKDETIKKLGDTLETIAKDQKKAVFIAERRALAEERHANAMENIARCIGKYTGVDIREFIPVSDYEAAPDQAEEPDTQSAQTEAKEPAVDDINPDEGPDIINESQLTVAEKLKASAKINRTDQTKDTETSQQVKMDKDDIMDLIMSMRDKGSTYNEIASHLADLDLPTFSGRGQWHAQTIHRLCQS